MYMYKMVQTGDGLKYFVPVLTFVLLEFVICTYRNVLMFL